jgi:hypothetical protein
MSTLAIVGLAFYLFALCTSIILLIKDDLRTDERELRPWAKRTLWIIAFPIALIILAGKCMEYVKYHCAFIGKFVRGVFTHLSQYMYEERKPRIEEE